MKGVSEIIQHICDKNRHKYILLCIGLLNFFWAVSAEEIYYTRSFMENIRTLQISKDVINLGDESDVVDISFDELSHTVHTYSYTIYHLNADWTRDNLSSSEYLKGFTRTDVTNYDHSFNTQQLYTHYYFTFPNEDISPTLTGNYAIIIFEDGKEEEPVATVCFSVVNQSVSINGTIRSNTNIEFNGRYQQLDIDVSLPNVSRLSPNEYTLVVEQNGRRDNMVYKPSPTYIESNRLRWQDSRQLIFEGGHEYQFFDNSSFYLMGHNVDYMHYDKTFHHVFLYPSVMRAGDPYITERDANGSYVVNAQKVSDDATEADYMYVHFILPCPTPFFDGSIYLLGQAWHNMFTPENKMYYDSEHKAYIASCYLKQGGCEWLYAFIPKGSNAATLQRIEGNHWETENTYRIYLYYRPFGGRYDELIGVK